MTLIRLPSLESHSGNIVIIVKFFNDDSHSIIAKSLVNLYDNNSIENHH